MACVQNQIRKFPWTKERVAALLDEAVKDFASKGATYEQTVDGLAARHNMKREIIQQGLAAREVVPRNITDKMWTSQQAQRQVEYAAKQAVKALAEPKGRFQRSAEWVSNAPRRLAVTGHFGAFTKTHLADQLFYNPRGYYDNFTKSWSLATERGRAQLESDLADMVVQPEYHAGVRAGLDLKPGGGGRFTTEAGEVVGTPKTTLSSLAFDRLRLTRYNIWKNEYAKLSPEELQDKEGLKGLAAVINHDTGTAAVRSRILRFVLFAPRLLPAQAAHTFYDIPKALAQTGFGFNYKDAPAAARYVARKTAILAGAYTGTLAAGTAYAWATGDKRFMPNLGDPSRTDWLRPRLFGLSVPISPTVELLKVPIQMIAAGAAAKNGQSAIAQALMRGLETAMTRQNPLFAIIEQSIFGQETGTGRPMPRYFPSVFATQETATKPRLTWTELLGSKLPIPAANVIREVYDEMREQGMDHPTAITWASVLARSVPEAITAYHLAQRKDSPGQRTIELLDNDPIYQALSGEDKTKYGTKIFQQVNKTFKEEKSVTPQPGELFQPGEPMTDVAPKKRGPKGASQPFLGARSATPQYLKAKAPRGYLGR